MRVYSSVVLGLILSAWCGLVVAQAEQGRGACAEDAKKLCKDVQPGGGHLAQCMKKHEAELSPGCKAHQQAMRQEMKKEIETIQQACQGDVEKFCKDVQPGGGRVARCLKQNEAQLSSTCKNSAQDIRARHQEHPGHQPPGRAPDRSPDRSKDQPK